jgi:hypothetical protein
MLSGQLPVKRGDSGATDTGNGDPGPAGPARGDSRRGDAVRGDNTNSMLSDVLGRLGPISTAASVDFARDLSEATSLMSSSQQHICETCKTEGREAVLGSVNSDCDLRFCTHKCTCFPVCWTCSHCSLHATAPHCIAQKGAYNTLLYLSTSKGLNMFIAESCLQHVAI